VRPRTRIVAYGSAVLLVVAGALVACIVSGVAGEATATGLISFGMIGAVSLIFVEVGLSEERARREEAERAAPRPEQRIPRTPWLPRWRRR
jgi:hypothetical protein